MAACLIPNNQTIKLCFLQVQSVSFDYLLGKAHSLRAFNYCFLLYFILPFYWTLSQRYKNCLFRWMANTVLALFLPISPHGHADQFQQDRLLPSNPWQAWNQYFLMDLTAQCCGILRFRRMVLLWYWWCDILILPVDPDAAKQSLLNKSVLFKGHSLVFDRWLLFISWV